MRILLIANTLPPRDISGVGEQVLQLAVGLRRQGHEVEVLGRGANGARGPKVLFPLTVVPATLKAIRRFKPDVVQVHESDGGLAAFAVAVVRGVVEPNPRLVALLQVSYRRERWAVRPLSNGRDVYGSPGLVERRFRWLKAPLQIVLGCLSSWLADRVLAPSRRTAFEIETDYGVGPVAVVPNVTGGLDVSTEEAPEHDLGNGYLLFVGRLRIRKGVEVLLEALARPGLGRAHLLVAGDGEHRGALEEKAQELGVYDRVRFLGRCSAGQVRSLLDGASALVVPSIYEGMPLVILEAMEAARPVIASEVSGIPEVVTNGLTGWLVPAEDPRSLAAALEELIFDPDEGRRRGREGRQRVREQFGPNEGAARWCEVMGMGRQGRCSAA